MHLDTDYEVVGGGAEGSPLSRSLLLLFEDEAVGGTFCGTSRAMRQIGAVCDAGSGAVVRWRAVTWFSDRLRWGR